MLPWISEVFWKIMIIKLFFRKQKHEQANVAFFPHLAFPEICMKKSWQPYQTMK